MRKDRVAALIFVNIDTLIVFLLFLAGMLMVQDRSLSRVGELSLTVAHSEKV